MRLTKAFFWLSDLAAWILLSVSAAGGVLLPIVARADREPMPWSGVILLSTMCFVVAAGAYGITRRRALSMILVAVPAIASGISGDLSFALPYLAAMLLVFGIPFVLVCLEARARSAGGEA